MRMYAHAHAHAEGGVHTRIGTTGTTVSSSHCAKPPHAACVDERGGGGTGAVEATLESANLLPPLHPPYMGRRSDWDHGKGGTLIQMLHMYGVIQPIVSPIESVLDAAGWCRICM